MPTVVIPDPIGSIPQKYLSEISKLGAKLYDTKPHDLNEVKGRIKDAEIITTNYIDVDKQLIDLSPSLKYIIVPAAGYNNGDATYTVADD